MEIKLFSYDTRFLFATATIYDDYRRPRRVAPRRISNKTIQKNPCPPCLGEALRREFHRIHYDFHGSGVNPLDSCQFLQSTQFLKDSFS